MWWDNAWDDAPAGGATFYEQLRIQERASGNLFSQGSIASVGKNSANQAYRGPGIGSFTPAQIQFGWRRLINLYKQISAEITQEISTSDPQSPGVDSEANIYSRGQLILGSPVTEYVPDLSNLFLPPSIGFPMPVTTP